MLNQASMLQHFLIPTASNGSPLKVLLRSHFARGASLDLTRHGVQRVSDQEELTPGHAPPEVYPPMEGGQVRIGCPLRVPLSWHHSVAPDMPWSRQKNAASNPTWDPKSQTTTIRFYFLQEGQACLLGGVFNMDYFRVFGRIKGEMSCPSTSLWLFSGGLQCFLVQTMAYPKTGLINKSVKVRLQEVDDFLTFCPQK